MLHVGTSNLQLLTHIVSTHTRARARQASFIRGGGGLFWTIPTHPTLDPPTPLLTHPDPPPSYNSVGSIFCKPNWLHHPAFANWFHDEPWKKKEKTAPPLLRNDRYMPT